MPTSWKGCAKTEDRIKSYVLQLHNLQFSSLTFPNNSINRKNIRRRKAQPVGIWVRACVQISLKNKQKPKFGLSKIAVLNVLVKQTNKKRSLKCVSHDCISINCNLLLSIAQEVVLIPFILSPLNDEGLFFFFKIWPFFCNYDSKKLILHSFWSYHEVQ